MPVDQPTVRVVEITSDRDKVIGADNPTTPDLGGRHSLEAALAEVNVGSIMSRVRQRQRRVFELTWKGNKVPRGAVILDKKIAWTQDGIVTAEGGEMIGSYERIVEFGGTTGRSQKMHVYMDNPALLGADGEPV